MLPGLVAVAITGALSNRGYALQASDSISERIAYPRPAVSRDITGPSAETVDPITGRRYTALVAVETEGPEGTRSRFSVHVPDPSLLGLGRRIARFLTILWGLADTRFATLNARLRSGCPDVWVCRDGDSGGEQTRSSIYLYDALARRSGVEWARIIAHEYGHYLLPGPSGYTEPESWSNGLFGERLFLGWIFDDMRADKLTAEDVGFLTLPEAEDYYRKQVEPLIERVAEHGPDTARMARKDKSGMDEAIALLLYADRIHGARAVTAMLDWMRPRLGRQPFGTDYLEAYRTWLDNSDAIVHRPCGNRGFRAYWPAGTFELQRWSDSLAEITVERAQARRTDRGIRVVIPQSGWRLVKIGPNGTIPESLTWLKQSPATRRSGSG